MLRAVGEMEIKPVGSSTVKKVNFKLITATNADLKARASKEEFRSDLYYRLTEHFIKIRPLRERMNEIDDLIDFFCLNLKGGPYQIDAPARNLLKSFDWPEGNIRELKGAIISMTVKKLADNTLTFQSVPQEIVDAVVAMRGLTDADELQQKIREIQDSGISLPCSASQSAAAGMQ